MVRLDDGSFHDLTAMVNDLEIPGAVLSRIATIAMLRQYRRNKSILLPLTLLESDLKLVAEEQATYPGKRQTDGVKITAALPKKKT